MNRIADILKHWALVLVLVAYLAVGMQYIVAVPEWEAPDEPAHYNYIRQLSLGQLPVIEQGDYNQEYQSEVISADFADSYSVEPFEYEDHQPPLYYLLQTPLFLSTDGDLLVLRLFSLLIGLVTVAAAYLITEQILGDDSWSPMVAASFVAFVPQHTYMMAMLNNDSLAEALIGVFMLMAVAFFARRDGAERISGRDSCWLVMGVTLGLAFVTKVTSYYLIGVAVLLLLLLYWRDRQSLLKASIRVAVPSLAIGALWWIRNLVVYGRFDFLGLSAHDDVVIGQPRTIDWITEMGVGQTVWSFASSTFRSFWGQFGWMEVPMQPWTYWLLLVVTAVAFIGLVLELRRATREQRWSEGKVGAAALLTMLLFLSVAGYFYYNITFVQHQGRYLFAGLIPLAVGMAAGLKYFQRPIEGLLPGSGKVIAVTFMASMIMLNLLAIYRYVIPNL